MKKTIAILLSAALLMSMAACRTSKSNDKEPVLRARKVDSNERYSEYEGVSVQVDDFYLEDGKTNLVVIWSNETSQDAIYGASYVIERYEDGQWVDCAKREELSFIAIAYELSAGQQRNEIYDLTNMYDVSKAGRYRFKTTCSAHTEDNSTDHFALWAEFTLSEDLDESEINTQEAEKYGVQYIRTNGYQGGVVFPKAIIIRSTEELNSYYEENKDVFWLERNPDPASDSTPGFLDACDKYDAQYFENGYLVFVLLEEGSGSIRHEVTDTTISSDGELGIYIARAVPEVGTCDMAQWHIILEMSNAVEVKDEKSVQVYLDSRLAWNGSAVAPPRPEAAFKKPPEATLRTPDGDAALTAAGYHWTYENPDGTEVTSIADQASRPLPSDILNPVTISSKYAETVYAPIPGSTAYAPTNSLGYLVKLDWEAAPSSVTYTCWPEAVWQNSNTPEEAVVSYQEPVFYAKPGGYIYEIAATWDDTGVGYHGTANYYVYITDESVDNGQTHLHMTALRPQTVAEPITGYCGNSQTTLHIGEKDYTFMYGHSVTLTDILVNLNYDPNKVCRCMAQYRADTEFGAGYQIHLEYGFVRCEKGQADLTPEQIKTIAEIIEWAETTNCQYSINN